MKVNTLIDTISVETVLEEVSLVLEEQNMIYYFNKNSIDNIKNYKIYNKETFNYFSIYNKNIYLAFIKIKEMFKKICVDNEINIDKNMYYIQSDYFKDLDFNFWHDSGGDRPLCFSGYIILQCEEGSSVCIDNEIFNISVGSLIICRSNSKTVWNSSVSAINFNIAPISMLEGQYKQKWIPIQ